MEHQRPGMFVPALIGGALAGILTGIPLGNCFCCLWLVGGGVLAAYFLRKESAVELTAGDGAIVGIFAGMVAAVVAFLVSIPLAPLDNALEDMARATRRLAKRQLTWFHAVSDLEWYDANEVDPSDLAGRLFA